MARTRTLRSVGAVGVVTAVAAAGFVAGGADRAAGVVPGADATKKVSPFSGWEQQLDTVRTAWRMGYVIQTASKGWSELPFGWGGCELGGMCGSTTADLLIPTTGRLTFTFSGSFTRAPVEIRVVDPAAPTARQVLAPGIASFAPSRHGRSFSFTWESTSSKRTLGCDGVRMEWRSPTGEQVRLQHSSVVVHYKKSPPRDDGARCID